MVGFRVKIPILGDITLGLWFGDHRTEHDPPAFAYAANTSFMQVWAAAGACHACRGCAPCMTACSRFTTSHSGSGFVDALLSFLPCLVLSHWLVVGVTRMKTWLLSPWPPRAALMANDIRSLSWYSRASSGSRRGTFTCRRAASSRRKPPPSTAGSPTWPSRRMVMAAANKGAPGITRNGILHASQVEAFRG